MSRPRTITSFTAFTKPRFRMRYSVLARSAWLLLAALLPGAAFASLHADFGPLGLLFMPLLLLQEAAPLALLAAAWLFWKKGHPGWLFACVAAGVALNLLVRLLLQFSHATGSEGSVLQNLRYVYALMDWLFLVAAIMVVRKAPAAAAPGQ
jgi:hypothetical protein